MIAIVCLTRTADIIMTNIVDLDFIIEQIMPAGPMYLLLEHLLIEHLLIEHLLLEHLLLEHLLLEHLLLEHLLIAHRLLI